MTKEHRVEAKELLLRSQEALNEAWEQWNVGRREAMAQREALREQKHAEYLQRQQRREERQQRIRANIEKNEERLEHLVGRLASSREYLERITLERDTAWSDSFRERKDEKIGEVEEQIADLLEHIERVKGWIAESRDQLN